MPAVHGKEMGRLRRILILTAILLALLLGLSGCRPLVDSEEEAISIYATVYPIYALTEGLMSDVPDAELHCLVQPQDGCLRAYSLSDWDIYLLASSADAIIAGGRGLESYESTLFSWGDAGPAVSAVLYNIELYNQDDNEYSDEDSSHLDGANPHLYMSVSGAKQLAESIAATLVSLDPDYADTYVANEASVQERLDALAAEISDIAGDLAGQPVILMNEALIYLAQDLELDVAEWYDRESSVALYDDELQSCLEKLSSSEAKVILIERQAPQIFVEALESAGFVVAKIDIFSTHRAENGGFEDYLKTQRENVQAIRAAYDQAAMMTEG